MSQQSTHITIQPHHDTPPHPTFNPKRLSLTIDPPVQHNNNTSSNNSSQDNHTTTTQQPPCLPHTSGKRVLPSLDRETTPSSLLPPYTRDPSHYTHHDSTIDPIRQSTLTRQSSTHTTTAMSTSHTSTVHRLHTFQSDVTITPKHNPSANGDTTAAGHTARTASSDANYNMPVSASRIPSVDRASSQSHNGHHVSKRSKKPSSMGNIVSEMLGKQFLQQLNTIADANVDDQFSPVQQNRQLHGDADDPSATMPPQRTFTASKKSRSRRMPRKRSASSRMLKRSKSTLGSLFSGGGGVDRSNSSTVYYMSQEMNERSLLLFWPEGLIRQCCIRLASSKYFINFNLCIILCNCVTMGLASGQPTSQDYGFASQATVLNTIDAIFSAIFTFECIVKCIAGGFLFAGPSSYLKSPWNVVDFVVVVFALLTFIPSFNNFTYIRTLRLLRPLKAATNIPGLRVMMYAMFQSVKALGNVALFIFLLLFTFGLLGLQVFRDQYVYRCTPIGQPVPFQCPGAPDCDSMYGFALCSPDPGDIVGFTSRACPTGWQCVNVGIAPYGSAAAYNNIVQSWLMSLIVMSGEGWTDYMYASEDAVSKATLWYFLVLTALSNYIGGSLIEAVMSVRFENAKDEEKQRLIKEKKQAALMKKMTQAMSVSRFVRANTKVNVHDTIDENSDDSMDSDSDGSDIEAQHTNGHGRTNSQLPDFMRVQSSSGKVSDLGIARAVQRAAHTFLKLKTNAKIRKETQKLAEIESMMMKEQSRPGTASSRFHRTDYELTKNALQQLQSHRTNKTGGGSSAGGSHGQSGQVTPGCGLGSETGSQRQKTLQRLANDNIEAYLSLRHKQHRHEHSISRASTSAQRVVDQTISVWLVFRTMCCRIALSSWAEHLGQFWTLLNLVTLCTYHWDMPTWLATTCDNIEFALTICLTVEFVVRLLGFGVKRYFKNGYNVCDLIVVCIGYVSVFGSQGQLKALQALRIVRVFTIFRHYRPLRLLMDKIYMSIEDLFYMGLLYVMFVFIFAQLGVQIAQNSMQSLPQGPGRDNFDNLGWACITVFQTTTPENWNQIVYDLHQSLGWGAVVYIVVTYLIGHYVIETLFVVVMLSDFAMTDDEKDNIHYQLEAIHSTEKSTIGAQSQTVPLLRQSSLRNQISTMSHNTVLPMNDTADKHDTATADDAAQQHEPMEILPADQDMMTAEQKADLAKQRKLSTIQQRNESGSKRGSVSKGFLAGIGNIQGTKLIQRIRANVAESTARVAAERDAELSRRDNPVPSSDYEQKNIAGEDSNNPLDQLIFSVSNRLHNVAEAVGLTSLRGSRPSSSNAKNQRSTGLLSSRRRTMDQLNINTDVNTNGMFMNPYTMDETMLPMSPVTELLVEPVSPVPPRRSGLNLNSTFDDAAATSTSTATAAQSESTAETDNLIENAFMSLHSSRVAPEPIVEPTPPAITSVPVETDTLTVSKPRSQTIMIHRRTPTSPHRIDIPPPVTPTTTNSVRHSRKITLVTSPKQATQSKPPSPQPQTTPTKRSTVVLLNNDAATTEHTAIPTSADEPASNRTTLRMSAEHAHDMSTSPKPPLAPNRATPNQRAYVKLLSPSASPQPALDSPSPEPDNAALLTPMQLLNDSALNTQRSPLSSSKMQSPLQRTNTQRDRDISSAMDKRSMLVRKSSLRRMPSHRNDGAWDTESVATVVVPSSTHSKRLVRQKSKARFTGTMTVDMGIDFRARKNKFVKNLKKMFTRTPKGINSVIPHHYRRLIRWFHAPPPEPMIYRSLFCLNNTNSFRQMMSDVVYSNAMNIFVVCLILTSCVTLALDSESTKQFTTLQTALRVIDYITTGLYVTEMLMRVTVMGLVLHPGAYLRNEWNLLETMIIIVSLLSYAYPSIQALKALRALRPLRFLSRIRSARVVVVSLYKSMQTMFNVFVVSVILMLMMSVVAVQLFQGRLQQCTSPTVGIINVALQCCGTTDPACCSTDPVTQIQTCQWNDGLWINPLGLPNYDNIGNAMLAMFELTTEENWPTIMYSAVDSTEFGQPSVMNNNQVYGVYFVTAIIVGSLFVKNLFTATILDGYSKYYAEITGTGAESVNQIQSQWLDFYKLCVDNPPKDKVLRPRKPWLHRYDLLFRRKLYDLTLSRQCELFYLGVIAVNILVLSMPYSGQDTAYANTILYVNWICTWLYVLEVLMLWFANGIKQYFKSNYNTFDFVVVLATVFEFLFEVGVLGNASIGFDPSLFRVIRLIRIFKLFRQFPRLVQLGNTLWFSLPALQNVAMLLFLLFFIYSIAAMNLFGRVVATNYLTRHGNFTSWTSSMVTLFRMVTGENWNGIMRDCMIQPPFCSPELDNCGNPVASPLIFVTFMLFSSMLIVELILAVILNQFSNELDKEDRLGKAFATEQDIIKFGELWSTYTHLHTMGVLRLTAFLRDAELPRSFDPKRQYGKLSNMEMATFIDTLAIPCDDENQVHYLDVIHQLGERAFYMAYPEALDMGHHSRSNTASRIGTANTNTTNGIDSSIGINTVTFHSQTHNTTATGMSDPDSRTQTPRGINRANSLSQSSRATTTAGIRLMNDDLILIRQQAHRSFPVFQKKTKFTSFAGELHRVLLLQKVIRGFITRKRFQGVKRTSTQFSRQRSVESQAQSVNNSSSNTSAAPPLGNLVDLTVHLMSQRNPQFALDHKHQPDQEI